LHAADGVAHAHAADASLVAGNTLPDVVRSIFTGLVGQLRIRDQSPHHVDHVALTFLQDLFSQVGIVDAVGGIYGQAHHGANTRGQRGRISQRRVHGAFHQEKVVKRTQTDIDEIDFSGLLQPDGDAFGLLVGDAAVRVHLVGIQPNSQGKAITDNSSDRIDHLQGKSHPVVKTAAIGIASMVGGRRQELPDQ